MKMPMSQLQIWRHCSGRNRPGFNSIPRLLRSYPCRFRATESRDLSGPVCRAPDAQLVLHQASIAVHAKHTRLIFMSELQPWTGIGAPCDHSSLSPGTCAYWDRRQSDAFGEFYPVYYFMWAWHYSKSWNLPVHISSKIKGSNHRQTQINYQYFQNMYLELLTGTKERPICFWFDFFWLSPFLGFLFISIWFIRKLGSLMVLPPILT